MPPEDKDRTLEDMFGVREHHNKGRCDAKELTALLNAVIDLSLHHREYHGAEGTLIELSLDTILDLADIRRADIVIRMLVEIIRERGFSDVDSIPSEVLLALIKSFGVKETEEMLGIKIPGSQQATNPDKARYN